MCGIIGIVSNNHVTDNLLKGLKLLEYRGYDSSGIAIVDGNYINVTKSEGKISNLEKKIDKKIKGNIGIAHTRWATHGRANIINAHPHISNSVAIVHNGIIENYIELRSELINFGFEFVSETDSEIIAHLISYCLKDDPLIAVKYALSKLIGSFAIAIIFADHDMIIATKKSAPLIIGYGKHENYLCSDSNAINSFTNKISYLEDDDIAVINSDLVTIYNNENIIEREMIYLKNNVKEIDKGNYTHFMLKEIHEQPNIIKNIINKYFNNIDNIFINYKDLKFKKINIIACGTSYYSAMVAKYWFEEIADIEVNIDIASEFRYRESKLDREDLSIFISQSGETADTIAALLHAKSYNQYTIAVINVKESSMARIADDYIEILAGPEIGVASTKAFTAQLMTLCFMVIYFAKKKKVDNKILEDIYHHLRLLPIQIESILSNNEYIEHTIKELLLSKNILYTGRGISYAISQEAALKFRELSYIGAISIASGELKHGTIALIDSDSITIAIIPNDRLFDKTLSNLNEIKSRNGKIIAITDYPDKIASITDHIIKIPQGNLITSPILSNIIAQNIAYYSSVHLGNDVDQPRNLAKSVTVE